MEGVSKYKLLDGDFIRESGAAFLNNYSVIITITAGLNHDKYCDKKVQIKAPIIITPCGIVPGRVLRIS